ncbi:dolichyldiphosphatase 1-like [Ctenocephalides felis]|uniref:dolichyldiphosphatase 1-like n=1 Tax=Ctenocephalides felis TaxID=7515 RepID=UPI000E6E47F6|nr:dolichyldiphosphatase 1-like [Ctenocephalides felis]
MAIPAGNNVHDIYYDNSEWKPISLTLVEYPKEDLFGQILAWLSLAPLAIGAGFVSLILFRRDLHTITFFIGTLCNEFLNMTLKMWIQQPRPVVRKGFYSEYGMPSSHAQFMCFFSTYYCYLFHVSSNSALERCYRVAIVGFCWLVTFFVCIGRVYLLYHTISQVLWGALGGILFGLYWFSFTHIVLGPLFPHIVSWKISEILLLRDTTLIPNVLWFEYTVTRQEARSRARKLNGKIR